MKKMYYIPLFCIFIIISAHSLFAICYKKKECTFVPQKVCKIEPKKTCRLEKTCKKTNGINPECVVQKKCTIEKIENCIYIKKDFCKIKKICP